MAAKKKGNRLLVAMVCTVCNTTNKTVTRNKVNDPKLELSLYCKKCQKHTSHKSKDKLK